MAMSHGELLMHGATRCKECTDSSKSGGEMAVPSPENVEEDRAQLVLEKLQSDQNLGRGLICAFLAGVLGVALAHGIALSDIHARTTIATAFIGVLVAFGMKQWGRGVDRRFRVAAVLLTAVFMFISVVLAGCVHRAATSRYTFEQLVNPGGQGLMSLDFALVLFRESLNFASILRWTIGLGAAWLLSGRRIRAKDLRV